MYILKVIVLTTVLLGIHTTAYSEVRLDMPGRTLVQSSNGHKKIKKFKANDFVSFFNSIANKSFRVKVLYNALKTCPYDEINALDLIDNESGEKETLYVHRSQMFYLTNKKEWVKATELLEGDQIATSDEKRVVIVLNSDIIKRTNMGRDGVVFLYGICTSDLPSKSSLLIGEFGVLVK